MKLVSSHLYKGFMISLYAKADAEEEDKYACVVSLDLEELNSEGIVLAPTYYGTMSDAKSESQQTVNAILFSCVMLLALARDVANVSDLGTEARKGKQLELNLEGD